MIMAIGHCQEKTKGAFINQLNSIGSKLITNRTLLKKKAKEQLPINRCQGLARPVHDDGTYLVTTPGKQGEVGHAYMHSYKWWWR